MISVVQSFKGQYTWFITLLSNDSAAFCFSDQQFHSSVISKICTKAMTSLWSGTWERNLYIIFQSISLALAELFHLIEFCVLKNSVNQKAHSEEDIWISCKVHTVSDLVVLLENCFVWKSFLFCWVHFMMSTIFWYRISVLSHGTQTTPVHPHGMETISLHPHGMGTISVHLLHTAYFNLSPVTTEITDWYSNTKSRVLQWRRNTWIIPVPVH